VTDADGYVRFDVSELAGRANPSEGESFTPVVVRLIIKDVPEGMERPVLQTTSRIYAPQQ
jgi:hypothetical protein